MTRPMTVYRRGQPITFTTRFDTDREAMEVLTSLIDGGAVSGEFPESLASQHRDTGGLSPRQWPWVHKLVMDAEQEASRVPDLSVDRVYSLLSQARERGLQKPVVRAGGDILPAVRLSFGHGDRIVIRSNFEGQTWDERIVLGTIDAQGRAFLEDTPYRESVKALLLIIQEDPEGFARTYGRNFGSCCFCGRLLEKTCSILFGYGPICAEKYGLPWGDEYVQRCEQCGPYVGSCDCA